MSIASSVRKAGPYVGNDVTTVFPFAFKVFSTDEVRVVHTDLAGVETDWTLGGEYTVTLNADQDNDPGGYVTAVAALPLNRRLTLTSNLGIAQPLVLTSNGGFYPRVINNAFDRITIIAQQIHETLGRAIKLPISSTANPNLPAPVANNVIAWNSTGNGFVNIGLGDLATVSGYADARVEVYTGTGAQTAFAIVFNPGVLANLDVSVGGVTQTAGVDFTWAGTTVTFTTAPPAGATVQIRYARPLAPVPNFDSILTSVGDAQASASAASASASNAAASEANAAAILASRQPLDADLTAIAALPSAADKIPYATGAGTWALATLTSFARTLLATASNNAFLAALGQIASTAVDFLQAGTGAVTRALQGKLRDTISVKDFGAVGDGVTNDTAAFNAACVVGVVTGSDVIVPPGYTYMLATQWLINCSAMTGSRMRVIGYGAEIKSSHAGSAIKVTGRSTPHGITLEGIKINHRANATASAGFELTSTDHARLVDCVVEMHGVSATYKPYWLHNETAADNDTGCFWTTLENVTLRKRSGADVGNATYGIFVQGAANATTIRGGALGSCTSAIYATVETGLNYLPNALLVDGVAMEGVGVGIDVVGTATATIAGMRVVNNRFELVTTACARFTGTSLSAGVPPFFAGNYATPDVLAYTINANNIRINTLDCWTNPDITTPKLLSGGGFVLESTNGGATPLQVNSGGGARGIKLNAFGTTDLGGWTWQGVTNEARFAGAAASKLALAGVKAISGTLTDANNLRGTATLSAGTVAVAFATAEPDATYFLSLSSSANETFRWASKATGGFTINSSNAASTAVVDWILIR